MLSRHAWLTVLFCLWGLVAAAQVPAATGLAVSIVPLSYAHDGIAATIYARQVHVILHNTSDHSIRIWDEQYSWGYYGLFFEITSLQDGRKQVLKKLPGIWEKNVPAYFSIAPQGFFVFDVDFSGEGKWPAWPAVFSKKPHGPDKLDCVLRAVYSIEPDDWSRKLHVWTGTVSSSELRCTLYP